MSIVDDIREVADGDNIYPSQKHELLALADRIEAAELMGDGQAVQVVPESTKATGEPEISAPARPRRHPDGEKRDREMKKFLIAQLTRDAAATLMCNTCGRTMYERDFYDDRCVLCSPAPIGPGKDPRQNPSS